MEFKYNQLVLSALLFASFSSITFAATPINLRHQNLSQAHSLTAAPSVRFIEISRDVDFKKTLHVRIQQTYAGYQVWGADAVVHIPNGAKTSKSIDAVFAAANSNHTTMNGIVFQDLNTDLQSASSAVFTQAQADQAIQMGIQNYQHKIGGQPDITEQASKLIVFVDKSNKAHWAYKVSFFAAPIKINEKPTKPTYIMDATSFQVYAQWDDIQTLSSGSETIVDGGGFGGNIKMGQMSFDGLRMHFGKLSITRDAATRICSLKNNDVMVKDYNTNAVMQYGCVGNKNHNGTYWDGQMDAVNDGYSPGNDALFGGQVIKRMYKEWYGVPVLTKADGSPMMLSMVVHMRNYDNAFWDGKQMTFGDGYNMFYPLTSLGVSAHEISHGFTQQHSNLQYTAQSGGMNEAFSDMAAEAAEVYAYGIGKNSWEIGPEIFKAKDEALRYMYQPSKDCYGKTPGDWCSIDDASEYNDDIDVHYSSGVYNHFFYLLGTTDGWNAKKAFDVMVAANENYWTSTSTYVEGACGVISAATDLGYNVDDVKTAFDQVKVDYSSC